MPFRFIAGFVLGLLCFSADQLSAQPDPEPKDGKVTLPMTLSPVGELKPASRLYLLPEAREAIQGNRVQMFLRCFMEQDNFFGKVESEKRDKWNNMPIKDLPLNDVKNYGGRLIRRDMHDAARMTNVDWQILYFARRDGYLTLLPDVQKMRSLANVLKTRVRGEIAAGDFDGALHDLKTFMGLAKSLEHHPTLIGHLVGVAISEIALKTVDEMIQQPGCPNLYWAMTDLPVPFMPIRAGLEGERMFVTSDIEALKTAADPVSEPAIIRKIESYDVLFKKENPNPTKGNAKEILTERAKNKDEVAAARRRLIDAGNKAEHVNVWTPLHVVLLDEVRLYEEYRDELTKWLNLPYWQAKPGIAATEVALKKVIDKSPFLSLVPAVAKLKIAQTRLDQHVAILQHLEAIRLYAHANDGKLPATLSDIKLPLAVDPMTGKPFEYTVKDGVATLHGENPIPGSERTNKYYEIRIRK